MNELMVNSLIKEFRRIVSAFIFYSRIPLPSDWYSKESNHSSRYFSLVGCFVGGASAAVWMLTQMLFSVSSGTTTAVTLPIAVLLGMATAVLLTGALHEDGFADTFDGPGVGWSWDCLLYTTDSRDE